MGKSLKENLGMGNYGMDMGQNFILVVLGTLVTLSMEEGMV